MIKIINIIFLVTFFTIVIDAEPPKKVILVSNSGNWIEQFKYENTTYVLKQECDLVGKTLKIPSSSRLRFEGGIIKNGTVKGNNTCIEAGALCIFKTISISGTWKNKVVYSQWLDFVAVKRVDNVKNFRNLLTLCRSDMMTHLYTQSGAFYCSVKNGTSCIRIPSNVYWHNSSTICQLPTDYAKYSLILLHESNNVTIDGGVFVGDVKGHKGGKGEWGHGIKLAGATNITLKNLVAREFWGDGIDLIEADYVDAINAGVGNCKKIVIENVKCLYNRRQGMSIEAAENVIVKNSEFAFTGKISCTAPGSGVDIEPWCRNERKIWDISFTNCCFHDNFGGSDFCCMSNSMYRGANVKPFLSPQNAIHIKDCKIGRLYIEWVNDAKFENCEIEKLVDYSKGANVLFLRSRIKKRPLFQSYAGAKFIKCER